MTRDVYIVYCMEKKKSIAQCFCAFWWSSHSSKIHLALCGATRHSRCLLKGTFPPFPHNNKYSSWQHCIEFTIMKSARPRPSRGPLVVLGVTCTVTVGAIIYSHYSQVRDRQVMREGVERDKERLRIKRKMMKDAEM